MKIAIDIPDELKNQMNYDNYEDMIRWYSATLYCAINDGIVLPKGYGRLIDADETLAKAWTNFYAHEDEWQKKDPDYLLLGRFYDQKGFECCQQTIVNAPTIIEADKEGE